MATTLRRLHTKKSIFVFRVGRKLDGERPRSLRPQATSKDRAVHCKVIIGRNPNEANANTVAIQLLGNPVAGKLPSISKLPIEA